MYSATDESIEYILYKRSEVLEEVEGINKELKQMLFLTLKWNIHELFKMEKVLSMKALIAYINYTGLRL